jgi:hypothetical protein
MTTTDVHEARRLPPSDRCVGSYATAYGALLAVEHLVDRGIPLDALRVVATDIEVPDTWLDRSRRRARTFRPLAVGLSGAAASIVIIAFASGLTVIGALAALLASGAVALMTRWLERWYAQRVRSQVRSSRSVEAARFDVVCAETPQRAAHLLARWWDPHAPPVAFADDTPAGNDEAVTARRIRRAA